MNTQVETIATMSAKKKLFNPEPALLQSPVANVGNVRSTLASLRATHAAIVAVRPLLENRKRDLVLSRLKASSQPDKLRRLNRIDRETGCILDGGDPQVDDSPIVAKWSQVSFIGLYQIPIKLQQLEKEIESISELLPPDSDISEARQHCLGIESELEATRETYNLEYAAAIEHLTQAHVFLSNAISLQSAHNSQIDTIAEIKNQYDLKDVSLPAKLDGERNGECKANRDQALQLTASIRNLIASARA